MIRNNGEDQEVHQEGLGGAADQHGRPSQVRGPAHIEFDSVLESRPIHTKLDAQITSGLGFGRAIYVWKAKKTTFLTDLLSYQKSFGIVRNRQKNIASRIGFGVASPLFVLGAMYLVRAQ